MAQVGLPSAFVSQGCYAPFYSPPPPLAAVYYVDNTGGDDLNDGLTPATAWKTLWRVNTAALVPDDQVLFKRGETWGAQLTPSLSGTPGHPIIFGAYGAGLPPKISGGAFGLDTNGKSHLTFRQIVFSGKEILTNGSLGIRFEYCLLRDSNANGLRALNSPSVTLFNCLVIGARDDAVLSDGSVVTLYNSSIDAGGGGISGVTNGGGGLNTANGGTVNYKNCLIAGNGYRVDWNIRGNCVDLGDNQIQAQALMTSPMKNAAFFCLTIDDKDCAYAWDAYLAIDPYGGKLTFFVIPSQITTAPDQAILAALVVAGNEVAVHSWSHADLTSVWAFSINSTNTTPTINVDVAGELITLDCVEVANRIVFDFSGNKTIGDLKTACLGKGWIVTNTLTVEDELRLKCLADSGGAEALPYSPLFDIVAPLYGFWSAEINDARDWIFAITGVTPKTIAFPFGSQNAALRAWLEAEGYEGARGTDHVPQTLASIELYNNRTVFDINGDGSEAAVRAAARHYYELMIQTARMVCYYFHSTGELTAAAWGWFCEELYATSGTLAVLQTFGSYVAAIRASHTPDGAGLVWTKNYPDVSDFHLKNLSPLIDAGAWTGLFEDIEGNGVPVGGLYDVGPYEHP